MRGWTVIAACTLALAGCALPGQQVELPRPDQPRLETLGYHPELDRHLFVLSPTTPLLVEHWRARAFPFGVLRGTCWQGEARFCTRTWFPLGLPSWKMPGGQSEHCGVQTYHGIKVEPNLSKEIQGNGYQQWVLEYHPSEQRAARWKCDLDPTLPGYPRLDNMAGY